MQVVNMMRKTVITATAEMSLAQAQQLMQAHRVGRVPAGCGYYFETSPMPLN